jgi:hypothetical protein
MLKSLVATFDRSHVPANLITVSDWKTFAHQALNGVPWITAARMWAGRRDQAYVLRSDGSLLVLKRRSDGLVLQNTYKPSEWKWQD